MLDKTKATMPGRQCSTENKEQKQDTRPAAGGQSLTTPEITEADNLLKGKQSVKLRLVSPEISGTAALAQLECTALQHTPYLNRCWGCEPVARTLLLHTSLGVVQTSPLRSPVLANSNIECRGQRNFAPADFIQDFGSSFAFWRWRRLISPFAAVTRNPAVLSPSCLKSSISSITSWGIRTVVICDFAFFAPVAITETPYVRCISVYAKKIKEKGLKCISLWASLNIKGDIHLSSAKPGSARNTNRASNHRR
ncbi:TPA: hypothetical protein JD824_RS16725 [Citrobacter freundii]|nr:hypothetical protein [Citrobacter freundii]HAH9734560.1 ash family protein [Escherichia coli]HCD1229766.1 hypothetical protein [Citrobacter freundii]HDT6515246.1 hypothetical protein [Citrobacter freundii]HEE9981799.1 hypothetical protein [Citrobacter freundii]